jgi:hypothetical protein
MSKEFIPYQEALALKELGFDEPCLAKYSIDIIGETIPHFRYNNRISQAESIDEGVWFNHNLDKEYICSAPLYQQAFRWFREKYRKVDYPEFDYDEQKWHCHSDYKGYVLFNTYEEAEQACLKKLIEIVKNKGGDK